MTTLSHQELQAQFERLEGRFARMRTLAIALAAGGLLVGALAAKPADEKKPPAELVVSKLTVVDSQGRTRIVLGSDAATDVQRISPASGLILYDAKGAERGGFSTMESGRVVIGMDAPAGVGAPMRDRIGLFVDPDGSACIEVLDNRTAIPVRIVTEAKGGGAIEFIDYDRAKSQVHVKRETFAGSQVTDHPHEFPPEK